MTDVRALEAAAWSAAAGTASPEQLAQLEADPKLWRFALEDLLEDAEDRLESVRKLTGPERFQVVADFEAENCKPFSYTQPSTGKVVSLNSFWRMPERLYDDPEELAEWTRAAVAAAHRAQLAKQRRAGGSARPKKVRTKANAPPAKAKSDKAKSDKAKSGKRSGKAGVKRRRQATRT